MNDYGNDIVKILEAEYGVGPVVAPVCAVLWAAEKIPDREVAAKEIYRLNRIKAKHGAPLVYVPYGHHAFV